MKPNPQGPVDHRERLLVAKDAESKAVLGVLYLYGCHPSDINDTAFGGDFFGFANEYPESPLRIQTGRSNLQEQFSPIHPEENQPIAEQHCRALQERLEPGSEKLKEMGAQVNVERAGDVCGAARDCHCGAKRRRLSGREMAGPRERDRIMNYE